MERLTTQLASLSPATRRSLVTVGVLLAGITWATWSIIGELAHRWSIDPTYSHGYLVPLMALLIMWLRRETRPAPRGIAQLVGGWVDRGGSDLAGGRGLLLRAMAGGLLAGVLHGWRGRDRGRLAGDSVGGSLAVIPVLHDPAAVSVRGA